MSFKGSRGVSLTGSRIGSLTKGVVLTAVKPPVLTAVNPLGTGRCVIPDGLETPLSSLFDRGLSWILAASGPVPGAGEKRWA
jgi:hypothetical protein